MSLPVAVCFCLMLFGSRLFVFVVFVCCLLFAACFCFLSVCCGWFVGVCCLSLLLMLLSLFVIVC